MNWNEITDKLLKRECSAVETYQQALRKERQESGRNAEFQELVTILRDHQQAASQLEAQIQQPERRAAQNFGGWGTWSKVVMGAANIFGDRMVLRALKAGEESGFKRYQEVLQYYRHARGTEAAVPGHAREAASAYTDIGRAHVQG